jgi:hypothetical protein
MRKATSEKPPAISTLTAPRFCLSFGLTYLLLVPPLCGGTDIGTLRVPGRRAADTSVPTRSVGTRGLRNRDTSRAHVHFFAWQIKISLDVNTKTLYYITWFEAFLSCR